LSTSTQSRPRPRYLLAILLCAPGLPAASLVLATVALLAVDGHVEGLLAVGAGALVPAVLWCAWRLIPLALPGPRRANGAQPSAIAELTITEMPFESDSLRWPPTRTIDKRLLAQ
jgi:hypothetical protein